MALNYLQLDADQIVATVDTLARRINERFPSSGLTKVCDQLLAVARQAKVRSDEIARPIWSIRILTAGVVIVLAIGILFAVTLKKIKVSDTPIGAAEFIQVLEAGFNAIILAGAALLFLFTLDTRIKRRRCLQAIHELRALAHIIDMHQLTKDPERILAPGSDTASSPKRNMTPFLLNRYLDYCSEMLALVGKIAALYVQKFADAESVSAVNDLEDLTAGLARKVWQKIMVLEAVPSHDESAPVPTEPAIEPHSAPIEPPADGEQLSSAAPSLGAALRGKGFQ
jgi:hypothetical protein